MVENQRTTRYNERYKFTGKERDWESGYDFFGARFYSSLYGFWTRVDPLADKYANETPYIYCGGNPIMYFDPDGRYQCNMITLTEKDPENPELATKQDAQLWLDTQDPLNNSSILYVTFHFEENASPEEIEYMAGLITQVIEHWNEVYNSLKGDDGGQRQIVLHACYGAQVAEKVAEQNPEVNVSGPTGRLETGEYYNKFKLKSRDIKNSKQIRLFGIIPLWRTDASWLTYRSDKKDSPPTIIKTEETAGHKVDRTPIQKKDN